MPQTKDDLELEKLREELRKAKADSDDAETTAAKNKREEAEAATPAAAARRAATAESEAAAARQKQIAALIPDFSKVERGELKLEKDGQPTAGTGVAGRAVKAAAEAIKREMWGGRFDNDWKLLVTSDAELAASDAAFLSVDAGLDRLTSLSAQVLESTAPSETEPEGAFAPQPEAFGALLPVVGALAQAVPGILSLLQTNRTVTTGEIEIDDLTAAAAVAGVMKGESQQRTVFHDSFRVLPAGRLYEKVNALRDAREKLIERKVTLDARTPPDGDPEAGSDLQASIALVASVGDSIDEFLKVLTAVPEGGTTSPVAAAALRQGLHDGSISHVLLVKSQSASAIQVLGENAFRKDPVAVLAAATITWMLIEATSGQLLDAGVSSGTAQATGKIGNAFHFDDPDEGGTR